MISIAPSPLRRPGRWLRAARTPLLWGLALLLTSPLAALDPTKELLQYSCQSWTRQNGLPVNGVRSLAQSTDGYLWLGTSAGLIRFDGINFKLIDLVNVPGIRTTTVTTLAPSQAGGLWVGMENGSFGRYDGSNLKLWELNRPASHPALNMRTISESPDGTVWLSAQKEAARITPEGRYEPFLEFSDKLKLNIVLHFGDSQGRQWVATSQHGLYYWKDGQLTQFPALDGTAVMAMAEDPDHHLWIATNTALLKYDTKLELLSSDHVENARALLLDSRGVLWIGTDGNGLGRYRAGAIQFLRKLDGLASDYVTALEEDKEGSLWVGTRDGLSRLGDLKFPAESAAPDSSTDFAAAVAPSARGGVWSAGRWGISYFGATPSDKRLIPNTAPDGSAKRVYEARNGDVYFVTGLATLGVISGEKVRTLPRASSLVVGIAEDNQGVLVSVGGKLCRVNKDSLTPYEFIENEPDFHWILNLASARDGGIWVASERGIFWVKDGKFKQYPLVEGAREVGVQTVLEDEEGTLWASGFSSMVRLKNGKMSVITRKGGLFDDNVYAIVPDDLGNFWIDSGRGIFRISRQQLNDFMDGKVDRIESVLYNGPDCVKTTDKTPTQEHSGCRSVDGRIWFPSAKGLVMIDPSHIPMNRNAPPVHLDRVVANGRVLDPNEAAVIPPGKGDLEFGFSALSFLAPERVTFRYQLQGYDHDWVETANRRVAFYTNLPPGRYTFRVIAANGDGVWNMTGDSLTLELRPHFRQTIWFFALCGGVIVALVGGAYYGRIRLLQQKQRALQASRDLLEIEVAHRTSELATANSSLQGEIENHRRTERALEQKTESLQQEIEERKRMQLEIERVHRELVQISRQAGMAEVATSVLHNVGNVLNSVNVSATLLMDQMKGSKVAFVPKVGAMLQARASDLANFFASDSRGKKLPDYIATLGTELVTEQQTTLEELGHLRKNIEHIKEIVAMQQNFATAVGVEETIPLTEIVDDAIRINSSALTRHEVELVRDYQVSPVVTVERHKVLQVLVNLIRNAKYACDEAQRTDKRVIIRITADETTIRLAVIDNGIGIPPENLTRIFSHGFTTKKEGHGFGLHSGALAAKELRGALNATSEGVGHGATFTLELPNSGSPAAAPTN